MQATPILSQFFHFWGESCVCLLVLADLGEIGGLDHDGLRTGWSWYCSWTLWVNPGSSSLYSLPAVFACAQKLADQDLACFWLRCCGPHVCVGLKGPTLAGSANIGGLKICFIQVQEVSLGFFFCSMDADSGYNNGHFLGSDIIVDDFKLHGRARSCRVTLPHLGKHLWVLQSTDPSLEEPNHWLISKSQSLFFHCGWLCLNEQPRCNNLGPFLSASRQAPKIWSK